MIPLAPRTTRTAWQPLPRSEPRTPCAAAAAAPAGGQTLEVFLRAWRADQVPQLRIAEHVSAQGAGYVIDQRPYVARRYHLANGRTGWALVHDDPEALAYFDKLFGAPAQGRLL